MLRYMIQRMLLMLPTLLGVALLVFFMLRVMPGDIVELKLRADGASVSEDVLNQERARLGLDKPLHVQLATWLGGMLVGDMGLSMWTGQPVAHEIAIRLELSLQVSFMATLIAVLISIPAGTVAALFKDTWIDYIVRVLAIAGLAVPSFWLGMITILSLLTLFSWLPPITFTPFLQDPGANLAQLIWPALAVGYRYSAVATRMTRSALLEVLREDYIRTARAKGLAENMVILRHALKNALIPNVTLAGLAFAGSMGGTVILEQIFAIPGMGQLFIQSINYRDYPVVQAEVMVFAVIFMLINLVIDVVYGWLDPRIRYN